MTEAKGAALDFCELGRARAVQLNINAGFLLDTRSRKSSQDERGRAKSQAFIRRRQQEPDQAHGGPSSCQVPLLMASAAITCSVMVSPGSSRKLSKPPLVVPRAMLAPEKEASGGSGGFFAFLEKHARVL